MHLQTWTAYVSLGDTSQFSVAQFRRQVGFLAALTTGWTSYDKNAISDDGIKFSPELDWYVLVLIDLVHLGRVRAVVSRPTRMRQNQGDA